ncbi:hypothetical protein DL546_004144 [Coniochaeta pulveracea]|uniref:Uncharacterized protein n=1 Tax=Coniochaeta pulveracea TaxID=177199 RepID=A0A420Y6Q0_9PEZI|nr:hypothetical protein DL546_004144 [Coniochaeta pulveracea]
MRYLSAPSRRNGAASITPMEFINDDGDDGGYDVDLAVAAEANEKDMTFKDARRADLRLIWYSLGFSGTIIMEGYGLALITYLFSFSEFNKNFGEFDEAQNSWEVR